MGRADVLVARAMKTIHARGFVANPLPLDHFDSNLPDYDVAQLRHWMALYFHKPTSVAYFVQMIICTVFLGIILIFGLGVIIYRLWDRTLWLFRIQDTRGSPLIIPNSISAFVLFEAAYALVWLADVWNNLAIDKWGADPTLTGFWNGTPWILLFAGAWCGAWGTFFASPGILHRSSRARGFDPRRLVPGPKLCNLIGISAPLAFTAASLAVSIPTGLTYKSAVEKWRRWDANAAQVSPTTYPVEGALRQEAAEVWKQITDAWWWSSVGWLALLVFAWAFLVFYVMTGGFLVYTIHSQLQSMRQRRMESRRNPQGHEASASASDAVGPEAPRWERHHAAEYAADMEMSRAQASTFFPPLATQGTTTTGPTTRKTRIRMLNSAMTNVTFIYSSISLGCLGFVVNLHWLLAQQYNQAIVGPVETNRTYEKYMAVASWVTSVFGIICFTAISQKTFEGVFEEWSAVREAKKRAKHETSKQSDSSATLTMRKASKTSSSITVRLKSIKSLTASATPIVSQAPSRTPSTRIKEEPHHPSRPGMDPAHARALQYFQHQRDAGLNIVNGQGDVDDDGPDGRGVSIDMAGSVRAQAGRSLHIPGVATGGEEKRHQLSTLPFDHYRLSGDNLDPPPTETSEAGKTPLPRMEPVTTPNGSLTPRRYGSAASGIIVQRAITRTSEDVRKYPQGSLHHNFSASASSLRSKSILKKEPASPRTDTWQTKFDAFHKDAMPAFGRSQQPTSAHERRQQFQQDDSVAFTDADIDLAEDELSSYVDSQSESGSVQHPARPSRPASSMMAISVHDNANVSPTFGTASLYRPSSPTLNGDRHSDATPRVSQAHSFGFGLGQSRADLSQATLLQPGSTTTAEAMAEAASKERRPSLRWDHSFDEQSRAHNGLASPSAGRRPRLPSFEPDEGKPSK
ncbi:hypothetical protein OC842_003713 [Tilletia horrida]|uniref:Uncharacterized protein n=1 Tax=Tilletia horrida TaxID=155126 RepID=A0AAN6GCC6_9BASI|nr:hypothetical protein OC842_003713 [Tilletia horrida]